MPDNCQLSSPILLVESYPQVIAGQQRTMMSLLSHAAAAGVSPTVLLPGGGLFTDRLAADGWDTCVVPYPESLGRYGGAIYRDGIGKRAAVVRDVGRYVMSLRRELKRIRPAAVFCNDMRGLLTVGVAAKSLGIPNITWDKLDKPHGILDWFQLPLVKRNPIISGPVAGKYPAWQRRWYKDRISIVPDGVDFEKYQGVEPIRESLGLAEQEVVFGIVGTVTQRKGHDLLFAALDDVANQHPNTKLLVIGSWTDTAEDRTFYETLPERDRSSIQFLGRRDDIAALMQSIDVLVIPSRFEGLGLVILEAMACGKPVIGSRVGGIAETVVDGVTGLLFENEDIAGLRDAMLRLVDDPALRRQMGAAGRERARIHYNRSEKMMQIWELVGEVSRKK
ncbi:GDP-mannose-dependent alpha-(1-6)-phosphatidylinositol monomannoside mannosyltransferase [Planctomycetes bacterium CA13]|uniref:GDP-mannose-dependent alpha-(1-6)-phosphatidylinositol monomannoside mannosyltransferase n=1 Tax=Novipirellula herctigrandis TaxID=2527986 RepID=A0A5C5YYF5_9BACT|nr:GDP-mannose-dependent alpha-(1-6)-phosphatidylinositol monomannoside mannosyltransferase [Planctomycetes bacterium CA13]